MRQHQWSLFLEMAARPFHSPEPAPQSFCRHLAAPTLVASEVLSALVFLNQMVQTPGRGAYDTALSYCWKLLAYVPICKRHGLGWKHGGSS